MNKKITNNKIVNSRLVDDIRVRDLSQVPNVEYRTEKNVLYFGLKLTGVAVVVLMLAVSLSSVGGTVSFYRNVEKSLSNFMQADPLSFNVEVASSTSVQIDLSREEKNITPVMTPDETSEPIQYFVKSIVTGGDSDLCDAVQVSGTFPFPYSGSLSSILTSTSTSVGAWTLDFNVGDVNLFSNKSCTVDLVYEGWNASADYGRGYKDKKTISLTFFVPEIVVEASKASAPESVVGNSPEETPTEIIPEEVVTESEEPPVEVPPTVEIPVETPPEVPAELPTETPPETPTEPTI